VAGGLGNTASGENSVVGGGAHNTSDGLYSVVPGGSLNAAAADYSFAAGRQAKANHQGSFVWADSQSVDFASTIANQFSIRAAGGVRLSEDTPNLSFGAHTRQMLNLYNNTFGIGVQSATLYFRCQGTVPEDGFIWYKGGVHNDGYGQPGAGGTALMHLLASGLYVNGALVSSSDRNMKQDFSAVDAQAVLEKVAQLPIQTWTYKNDPHTRHVGPMAQDFHAAFGVGPDDKHIATVDADGVALAAIQGLNQKVEEQRAENAALKQRLEKLEALMIRLNGGAR
jgi:hypothetical protein